MASSNKYFRQQRKIELIFGPICLRLPNIATDFMLMPPYKTTSVCCGTDRGKYFRVCRQGQLQPAVAGDRAAEILAEFYTDRGDTQDTFKNVSSGIASADT